MMSCASASGEKRAFQVIGMLYQTKIATDQNELHGEIENDFTELGQQEGLTGEI